MVRGFARIALWSLLSSVSLVPTAAFTSAFTAAPLVHLGYAEYQGYFDEQTNITRFLGIRYAAPPLGRLRFQAPQSPVREYGIQPATQNPEACYQGPSAYNTMPAAISEDCLFLNVFIPGTMSASTATTSGLPVLVWIHGGPYQGGYVAQYDGTDIVGISLNSMLVVVIQYRLGAFGFLAGNEMKAHGALNAGLLDQAFALQWVQEHIGLFGGDDNHVTIWGESAGGGSVLQHIVANGGNTEPPLFHAAMASSPYLPPHYHYNDWLPQSLYDALADGAGCASSANPFTCLQFVDAETLQAANYNLSVAALYGTFIFVPVIDGTFVLERPTVTLAKGQVNGQVLLAVRNQNEGDGIVAANETLKITEHISRHFPDMTPSQLEEAAYFYRGYGTAREQADMALGDSVLTCPTYYLLRAFAGRSWKGLFAVPPARHADDLAYYFRVSPSAPRSYDDPRFVAAFAGSFVSLAKNYDVNVKINPESVTPHWDMYVVGDTEMLFNRTEAGAPVITPIETDPRVRERCAFWLSLASINAQ